MNIPFIEDAFVTALDSSFAFWKTNSTSQ